MPCNDPEVNLTVTLKTKIKIDSMSALEMALYDLSNEHKSFFYEKIENGYRVTYENGTIDLIWDGAEYTVTGKERTGMNTLFPILSRFQAIKVQDALIEKGYLTETTQFENNVIQLQARRV